MSKPNFESKLIQSRNLGPVEEKAFQYTKKSGHMGSHMVNVNGNVNTNGINNNKGMKFDENFECVYFYDGSKQELGNEQKILAKTNGIPPSTIIRGSIY